MVTLFFFINGDEVVKSSIDFGSVEFFGTFGAGPGEFSFPNKLNVHNGDIYVLDAGLIKLLKFKTTGEFITEWSLSDRYQTLSDFVITDEMGNTNLAFLFNSPSDRSVQVYGGGEFELPISKINLPINDREIPDNIYDVLQYNGRILTVSRSINEIYVFGLDGVLLNKVNLPQSLFENRFRYKEKEISKDPEKENSTFEIIRDAYIHRDIMYLLLAENVGDEFVFYSNKVVALDCRQFSTKSEISIDAIYDLGDAVFQHIAVRNDELFAFDYTNSTLNVYRLDNQPFSE